MSMPTETASLPRRPFLGFERERDTYESCKNELIETARGHFVVFVGDRMIGPFSTEDDAERAGYEDFGLGPLYIKRLEFVEPVVILPPGIEPCRS